MRSRANGGFLGQSSSMLILDSVSLKIPEEPGGHAMVGKGSPHLPRPSYFTMESWGYLRPSHPFLLQEFQFYCPLCQGYPLLSLPEGSWWLSGPRSDTVPHHSIFKPWEQLPLLHSVYGNSTAKVSPPQGLVSSGM